MIKNFRHTCIVVKNLERSLKFYRDILGLKVYKIITIKGEPLERIFNFKNAKLIYAKMRSPFQAKNSPSVFELHYWQRPRILPQPGYDHISFSVKNIDYEYKRLSKLGVKFIAKPVKAPHGETKLCFAYDPDKHLIEFIEDL